MYLSLKEVVDYGRKQLHAVVASSWVWDDILNEKWKCSRIACESIGKRNAPRHVPWAAICRSPAVWAGVFALVCHEYPLVIMLQFLPNYMRDVLQFAPAKNGVISALPTACLFISKTLSSSFSTWLTEHTTWTKSKICKVRWFPLYFPSNITQFHLQMRSRACAQCLLFIRYRMFDLYI